MNSDDSKEIGKHDSCEDASQVDSRRDAMKKVALYSAYAAPVLLALTRPAKAIVSSTDS
jgi:hypothetical protein